MRGNPNYIINNNNFIQNYNQLVLTQNETGNNKLSTYSLRAADSWGIKLGSDSVNHFINIVGQIFVYAKIVE